MKKNLLIYSLSAGSLLLNAQTNHTEKELELIENPEQAFQFIKQTAKKKNGINGKILTFNEEKHKTPLTKSLFKLEKGAVKTKKDDYEKTTYKVLDKTKTAYYRLSYILIEGEDYTLESIEKLRDNLIDSYKKGTPFSKLASLYSMDTNAKRGGDTGWFTTDGMYADFENTIINSNRDLNTVFTVDNSSKNNYYVAIQTHEPKEISEIKVLRIIEPVE